MPVGGTGRPRFGIRYVFELKRARRDECVYVGVARLPGLDVEVEITVTLEKAVARCRGDADAWQGLAIKDIERQAALIVRTCAKDALTSGGRPPAKIIRWRP